MTRTDAFVPRTPKKRTRSGDGGGGPGRGSTSAEGEARKRARARNEGLLTAGTIRTERVKKTKGTKKDNGQEQTFYSSSDGTLMKKNLANVYKILEGQSTKNYYEWYSAKQLYSPRGAIPTQCTSTGTAGGQLPVHVMDVTSVPNIITGTITSPTLYHGALTVGAPQSMTTSSGSTSVTPVSFGQISNDYAYSVINSTASTNVAECYPAEKDRLLWSDIRLQLYGALNVPITWHVYFLQFKKPWLAPNFSATTGSVDEIAERCAFWMSMTKPLLFNPILVQDQKHLRDVKIIKHDVFTIAPKGTTETVSSVTQFPHIKTVKYFERWNKLCNYAWNDVATVDAGNDNGSQVSLGETRNVLEPTQRVYMVVACEAFTNGSFVNTNNGSYDIMVKNCHERTV